jgi:hypothetical protein
MGIEESYRGMVDQLVNLRASTFGELMRPALLQHEAARQSLAELMGPALLQEEAVRKSLAELMRPALLRQEAARESLTKLMWPVLLQQEAARQSLVELHAKHEMFFTHVSENSTHIQTSLMLSVRHVTEQWEKELSRSRNRLVEAAAIWDCRWRETFHRLEGIQNFGLSVPKVAIGMWPAESVSDRIGLIEHSFRNVSALQQLQNAAVIRETSPTLVETLVATGQFVFNYGDLLGRLPPAVLPRERTTVDPNGLSHRNEEVGAKLDDLLPAVDSRLQELRHQSWRKLSEGTAGARLAMLGLREVFNEILRLFAPDDDVASTDIWKNRADKSLARPTRRMRITHVMGSDAIKLSALLQFDASIEAAHRFAHTFADEPEIVRARMSQLETWIYLILLYARKGS